MTQWKLKFPYQDQSFPAIRRPAATSNVQYEGQVSGRQNLRMIDVKDRFIVVSLEDARNKSRINTN